MGGVSHGDQLRGSYHVRLKCTKNYIYIFGFLLDVAITNAYILHTRYDVRSDKPMDHKSFRMLLAEQLIGTYKSRKRPGRPRKRPHPTNTCTTTLTHLPSHSSSKRCVYCQKKRTPSRRKETVWVCNACDGHPSLCLTGQEDGSDCFRLCSCIFIFVCYSSLYVYLLCLPQPFVSRECIESFSIHGHAISIHSLIPPKPSDSGSEQ